MRTGDLQERELHIRACECGRCLTYGIFRRLDNRRVIKLAAWTPLRLG